MARRAPAHPSRPTSVASAPPAWISLAVGGLFLVVYLVMSPRASGAGDSSEFTVVLATLGLAHPTGYPLYTLIGHAFVVALHALGAGWAWAANAWSALGGAVAVGLWHALGARLLRREGAGRQSAALVALLPAAAFGLNPVWTGEATVAEINSWHLAWVAAACLLAWNTLDSLPAHRGDAPWVTRRVAAWSLLVGLGLSHHATSLIFAIPLTLALLVAARPLRAAWLAPGALGVVVPLLAWSYVLFRSVHPAAVQWGSLGPGVRETWNHVTAAGYRHYLGSFAPSAEQRAELAAQVYPWLAAGVLAALAWPFATRARSRTAALGLGAAMLAQTAYAFSYAVADPGSYFLPALALGVFLVPVAAAALGLVGRRAQPLAALAGLALVPAAWIWGSAALERRTAIEGMETFLHTMWDAVPIQRGYVLWDGDMSYRLLQYQRLQGEKPGLVVVRPRLLMDAGARALFERRQGFDPLGGAAAPPDAEADRPERIREFAARIGEGINRSTADSVILFLPEEPSLRVLPKPGQISVGR